MKVIFVDIDGVLNNEEFLFSAVTERRQATAGSRTDFYSSMIDPSKVSILNEVVKRTGCVVVISSSWRMDHNRHELQGLLGTAGFKYSILDCTPRDVPNDEVRGDQIQAWLDAAPDRFEAIESFVILDDEDDMGDLLPALVQTTFKDGLTASHTERLVSVLGEPS